jgi:glycosyltransferase involved in cell wall biosynthesis
VSDLTVFVGTFNRLATLERCLAALERQEGSKRIVIVDNGSTHEAAINYLDELEDLYRVYWMPRDEDMPAEPGDDEAHGGRAMQAVRRNYSAAFRREWDAGRATRWFAVCDCDTAPDGFDDSLARYVQLAEHLDCAVGPHLSLSVHRNYPLRSFALILNARVLFRERMLWHDDMPYSHDEIDSTFHLFPAAPLFDWPGRKAVRVGPPWWTTHTDWLIDVCEPTEENLAYILGSGEASRWAGTWIREMFAAYLRSPEEAFEIAETETRRYDEDEYCRPGFILSWMLQFGHGCGIDFDRSREVLWDSVPKWSPCWEYEQHWHALVYEDDQSCLGWEAA